MPPVLTGQLWHIRPHHIGANYCTCAMILGLDHKVCDYVKWIDHCICREIRAEHIIVHNR